VAPARAGAYVSEL